MSPEQLSKSLKEDLLKQLNRSPERKPFNYFRELLSIYPSPPRVFSQAKHIYFLKIFLRWILKWYLLDGLHMTGIMLDTWKVNFHTSVCVYVCVCMCVYTHLSANMHLYTFSGALSWLVVLMLGVEEVKCSAEREVSLKFMMQGVWCPQKSDRRCCGRFSEV